MVDGQGLRMDHEGEAAREEHAAQRDEEGRQGEDVDEGAHERAEARAEGEGERDGRQRVQAVADERGDEDAGEGDHGADRQVDAAGEDDEGDADGGDAEEGVVAEKVHQHAQRAEVVERDAAPEVEEDEHADGGEQRDGLRGRAEFGGEAHAAPPFLAGRRRPRPASLARRTGDWRRHTARMTTALGTGAMSALTLRA